MTRRLNGWLGGRLGGRWSDLPWAVLLTAGVVVGTVLVPRSGVHVRPLDAYGFALLALPGLALTFRRRLPTSVAVFTVLCCIAYYRLRYPGIFAGAPALLAIYFCAASGRRARALTAAFGFTLGMLLVVSMPDWDSPSLETGFLWVTGWVVAIVVIGEVVRSRRAYLHEVEQRAAEAERTREEAALRRAGEERLWIAQELHDTLTHNISVINVQVGAATHLFERRPEQVGAALEAIKEASREAMNELRATLHDLRQGESDAEMDEPPGIARLPRLVERAAAAGAPATLETAGQERKLPEEVDRAVYRIVQESLTNVLRHARGASVTVRADYRPDRLVLSVENDGVGAETGARGSGMGLLGMRERAVAAGGSLEAGPRPEGGFRVCAELPTSKR